MTVKELFSDSIYWTRQANARSAVAGLPVPPADKLARCWCLWGALTLCYIESEAFYGAAARVVNLIKLRFPIRVENLHMVENIIQLFNDHDQTTFEEVMQVVEEAGV